MPEPRAHRLVLITDALPAAARIWGTGGWQMPEEREALDWLTLARLLGWDVAIARPERLGRLPPADWIVVACDPDRLGTEDVARIEARLAAGPVLVVARAAGRDAALARLTGSAGRSDRSRSRILAWTRADGTSGRGTLHTPLAMADLAPGAAAWATLGRRPLVTIKAVGCGRLATLAAHPSALRDASGAGTALLTDLLVAASGRPVAWRDWRGTMVLRMDDPGAAQNVHLASWSYPKLHAPDWARVGKTLVRHGARLSIAYVSGWVDDGDATRGSLTVAGRTVPRWPGRVFPSSQVVYRDRGGHAPGTRHDGQSEFRGIEALRRRGLVEVELHGHTHMHPDTRAWARAPDRYTRVGWFRELGCAALPVLDRLTPERHPLARGQRSLARQFRTHPTTLVAPGDDFTDAALEHALDLGLDLASSYYTALRHLDHFAWCTHLCAPYLAEAAAHWFESGLPVVGYFHDRDLAVHGTGWLDRHLAAWCAAGATRFIDFRMLAAALATRCGADDATVDPHGSVPVRHHDPKLV
ncbi:MAG: hypothetical protein EXQ96_02880 [Alphaproteobacteria bacterium]|nr:hypothetical protein [Alphaproteobacteria bacterium]